MPDLQQIIQSGAAHAWLYLPTAILLGALHGLEPGHSKTMMAAFIIAIRGTIWQAVLLGLCAAVSHSFLISLLAIGALQFGSQWNAENIEPYVQLGSAAAVLGMALWMFLRTRRDLHAAHHHHHGHEHHHHEHGGDVVVETALGRIAISIFETGVPPVFQLRFQGAPAAWLPDAATVTLETLRPEGTKQTFHFVAREDYLESVEEIPEPHAFRVALEIAHEGRTCTAQAEFSEDGHAHAHGDEEFQDAHEREHAMEIERRFAGRTVNTPQIALFGLTGGLMPCPAAFSVLVVCLQLKRVTLGFAMVGAFSFGLALTMVASGVVAAWSVQRAHRKFRGFGEVMRRAPYVSCALLVLVAAYMAWHGWQGLHRH